ncbi:MAG TPA: zinc ABC transporter substrate-binding protein [Firmicutes bacterium]|nr:zinc ABC transporter substrate-binding protein [Bacillota bacterium]
MLNGKKALALILALCLPALLYGCGRKGKRDSLTVVASFYPVYTAAANITDGAEGVELVSLTGPQTGCLHDYQLSPQEMIILETADMLIINGAGMEAFLDKATAGFPGLKLVTASAGIELLPADETRHEQAGGEDSHGHDSNPHVWLSVSNYMVYVQNIAAELMAADPANAKLYEKNMEQYLDRLQALKSKIHEQLQGVRERRIITFHEAFPYFAREFDLEIAAVIAREPGTESSPEEIARIIDIVRETGCKVLFAEPQYPSAVAETIARETGAIVYTLDPVVTGEYRKDAYEAAMEKNLQTLLEALQ